MFIHLFKSINICINIFRILFIFICIFGIIIYIIIFCVCVFIYSKYIVNEYSKIVNIYSKLLLSQTTIMKETA